MSLKQKLDQDLKTAMLAGDKTTTTTLRGLKSAILNVEIEKNVREKGLSDEEVTAVLSKEAKKRQESADLYVQGGNQDMADKELAEKILIEKYLPEQIGAEELSKIVDQAIAELGQDPGKMGQIIGAVKQKAGGQADGGTIARLVKDKLAQ